MIAHGKEIKVFTANANVPFAKGICAELGLDLGDSTVTVKAKGGASGRLFGKVTTKEVAAALSQVAGTEIDKRKVEIDREIKDFGTYNATVRLHTNVTAAFKVKVEEMN